MDLHLLLHIKHLEHKQDLALDIYCDKCIWPDIFTSVASQPISKITATPRTITGAAAADNATVRGCCRERSPGRRTQRARACARDFLEFQGHDVLGAILT